jgi:voltage-gated potassium channel
MLRREFQRRLFHAIERFEARVQNMRIATERPVEFLTVLLSGAQIQLVAIGLFIMTLIGTVGYILIEGWSVVDAFYMTMITVTTVGFGEVREMGDVGRLFTVIIILSSFGLLTYGLSSAIEFVATGEVLNRLEMQRKQEMLGMMSNHFIIAGFGRVGREVASAFAAEKVAFVVVDVSETVLLQADELGYVTIHGSGTEDATLVEARIDEAKGLVACAGVDATNVYTVLTARGLKEDLFIIARATDDNSEAKMMRAGANRVISPYTLSGRRMANVALRPHVVDFLDITAETEMIEQTIEEVVVEEGSIIVDQTIGQVDLRRRTGANILALHLATGEWVGNPTAATMLEPGTRLILLGNRDQLDVTEALAKNFTRLTKRDDND